MAIHTAMLAAPVGIEGDIEGNIRGIIAAEDGPGLLNPDRCCGSAIFFFNRRPAVVLRLAQSGFESSRQVGRGTPAFDCAHEDIVRAIK
jgi:hypothetical protein